MTKAFDPTIAEAVAAYGWPPRSPSSFDDSDAAPLHAEVELSARLGVEAWGASLAPSADRVAFISDVCGAPRAYVLEVSGGGVRQLETGGEPVSELSWSPNGEWIACVIAPGGSVRHEIWLIRPDGSGLHLAAGAAHGSAFLADWAARSGRLGVTHAGHLAHDRRAYLFEPASGESELLAAADMLLLADVSPDEEAVLLRHGPRNARWLSVARRGLTEEPLLGGASGSLDGTAASLLHGTSASLPDGAAAALADGAAVSLPHGNAVSLPQGTSVSLPHGRSLAIPYGSEGSSDLGRFSANGERVYVRSDVGCERAALHAVELADGTSSIVSARADAELESFAISADRSVLVLLWNVHGGRSELSRFDPASGEERRVAGPPGDVWSGPSLSHDGRWLCLTAEGPAQPRQLWLIDLEREQRIALPPVLHAPEPPLDLPESPPQLLELSAADGVKLSGWWYPAGTSPGPVVIHLHGGPEAQERPVWNPLYNRLRAIGLGVFAPNVRGSSGFGRSFVHADNRERRAGAIADVKACVEHLIERGLADPARIGCMGRSYGGYLTLAALVEYPSLFAVGVDMCGMADLLTFYERTEPWIAAQAVSKYGHPEQDRELLRALSPLHRIERLRAPLLVVHGAHDTNVPLYEAEQVIQALARHGLPGGFLLFSDEGHELLQQANRLKYIDVVADWLAEHLDRR